MDFAALLTKYKNSIVILSAIALVTLIVVSINFSFNSRKATPRPTTSATTPSADRPSPTIMVKQPPHIKFRQWKNEAAPLSTRSSANTYVFKTDFTDAYIANLAKELEISGTTQKRNNLTLISTNESALLFNQNSGSFTYYSKQGLPVPNNENTEQSLYALLQRLGVYDNSMKVTATYQKQRQENMTYYEIHRDWGALNLPILNRFGLVSIPEVEKLSALSMTPRSNTSKPDNKIIATTDNSDGLSRNNDFNTITVVVYNNRILSISSNMRPLNSSVLSQVSVKPYDTALQNLQQGRIDSIVTAPAGSGFTDWNKVYPSNIAEADEAIVTDSLLTFLEDPLNKSQTDLKPFYVFRGYAMTKSGFRINFIASVDAVQRNNTWQNMFENFIKPVFALDNYQVGSQHQGTFELTVSPTISPVPTVISTIPPTQPPSDVCAPTVEQIQPLQDWEGLQVGWYGGLETIPGGYYLVGAQFSTETQLKEWIDRALERHEDGNFTDDDEGGIRELILIMNQLLNNPCPVRLTGPSPSLFLYSANGTSYNITPAFKLLYADPALKNNVWSIEDSTINNVKRSYIYYEYDPVEFAVPLQGWAISKKDLPHLLDKIADSLQLNEIEKQRLYYEVMNASLDISQENIYIGLIDENDINNKIPLNISPPIASPRRIHFYLTSHTPRIFSEPQLLVVERSSEMIIELGAVAYP